MRKMAQTRVLLFWVISSIFECLCLDTVYQTSMPSCRGPEPLTYLRWTFVFFLECFSVLEGWAVFVASFSFSGSMLS